MNINLPAAIFDALSEILYQRKAHVHEINDEIFRIIYHTEEGGTTVLWLRPNGVIVEESDDGMLHCFENITKYSEAW